MKDQITEIVDLYIPKGFKNRAAFLRRLHGAVEDKVSLADVASPNMSPAANKAVQGALERSHDKMQRVTRLGRNGEIFVEKES